jgi:methylated-DNA-protein-cysteine methyltransferase related protein
VADQAFDDAVAKVLASVGPGEVVTYGEIALEAGYPGRSRAVGRFLAEQGGDHCWWRVVNASGRLVPGHEVRQAELLRGEGVDVVDQRRVRFPKG